jgi:hypothetical protein
VIEFALGIGAGILACFLFGFWLVRRGTRSAAPAPDAYADSQPDPMLDPATIWAAAHDVSWAITDEGRRILEASAEHIARAQRVADR